MENKIELVCPECNEKFNVDIFTSINVQMDKDMKNRVLSGKLFDMECAHCHSKFHIPYPVLYHDMEKKLLIQFTEEKELQPIKKILDHANVGEDYTVRIVDNERDWIEKILISDSGYDDRIMELYKLLVLSQYEDADNVNALYYWNIQILKIHITLWYWMKKKVIRCILCRFMKVSINKWKKSFYQILNKIIL